MQNRENYPIFEKQKRVNLLSKSGMQCEKLRQSAKYAISLDSLSDVEFAIMESGKDGSRSTDCVHGSRR